MEFSVVVPSFESKKTIHKTIRSIIDNKSSDDDIEMIIVDSTPGGIDLGMEALPSWISQIQRPERTFAGYARNIGAEEAKAPWLCFLDSDCYWGEGWLDFAKSSIQSRPDILAFNGPLLYEKPSFGLDFALHLMEFHEFVGRKSWNPRFLLSANLLIKKSFFKELGGYSGDHALSEDFAFGSQFIEKNRDLFCFEPMMRAYHSAHLTDPRDVKEKAARMGEGRALVEADLSSSLSLIHRWWWRFGRYLLSEIFVFVFVSRCVRLRSYYLWRTFVMIPGVWLLSHIYFKTFRKKLETVSPS